MHPRRSAQEVLLCHHCKIVPLQSHCEFCNISLCKICAEDHISDSSKLHNVVPFLQHVQKKPTPKYPKCEKHANNQCKHYCEKCDIPICIFCVSSDKHKNHYISNIMEKLSAKSQSLQKDLEELETRIYPRYEEIASDVQSEKAELETKYEKLQTTAHQQGEILLQEVTATINKRKSDIQEMKTQHLSTLDHNTDDITRTIAELKQCIADLKSILKLNDVSLTSTYKSRNSEFRTLPPKVRVTLPTFSPLKINKDQLNGMFGSLSSLSIYAEHGEIMKSLETVPFPPIKPTKSPEAVSPPPVKQLLDEERLTATINTGYKYLLGVSCLNEEQVWTCGGNNIIKLLNINGKLLTSIKTESGHWPQGIAVTQDGDLVYSNTNHRTVNIVKNKQTQTMITLQGWKPLYVCSTASNGLLVSMISDDETQFKVVRYSGSTETQTIQFDDQGRSLYSSDDSNKYISENRNLDICLADWSARAVVVVNQSGKLRFRYTGHPSDTTETFSPAGITTDSQGHILTADNRNHRIHILDQDGQFLRYIHNLRYPLGLCVDIKDNLFVAEWGTAKVRKIRYL